jgi:signal transduction histidine kinase
VVVEVTDAGLGMSPELMDHATERFTRADEARARPGAGLGLAIVVALIENAGGELRLCYAQHHTRQGQLQPDVPCDHPAGMTATLILLSAASEHRVRGLHT